MAKKSTDVAVKTPSAVVARPAFLQNYQGPLGNEGIETGDVTIPRLKIAQAITSEVKAGDLKEGELYLNVTGQSVWRPGEAPLQAVIVAQAKEYILWRPRKDGNGGILARAKPVKENGVVRYKWDRPNESFDVKVEGKIKATWKTGEYIDQDGLGDWGSEIPGDKKSGIAATAHHNYVLVLPTQGNMIAAASLSKSQVKKAKDLNAVLKMVRPDLPIGAKLFKVVTIDDFAGENQFKNWKFAFDSAVEDENLGSFALSVQQGFQGQGFNVDQSDVAGSDEDQGRTKAF